MAKNSNNGQKESDDGFKITFRPTEVSLEAIDKIHDVLQENDKLGSGRIGNNRTATINYALEFCAEHLESFLKGEQQAEGKTVVEESKISESTVVSDLATSVLLLSKILVKKELPDKEIETEELTSDDLQM